MSAFSGAAFKGAMREHKKTLREEAEERATKTLPERTRQYRLDAADAALEALRVRLTGATS